MTRAARRPELRVLIAIAGIASVPACTSRSTDSPASDASLDSSDSGASWTDGSDGATADAAPGDAADSAVVDAGADAVSCDQLGQAARDAFQLVLDVKGSCQSDSDCRILPTADTAAWCIDNCGVLTGGSGTEELLEAGAAACVPFLAAGCPLRNSSCPVGRRVICTHWGCTNWLPYVTQDPARPDGGPCATFSLNYSIVGGVSVTPRIPTDAGAPRDLPVTVLADGVTVYSDDGCTTPAPQADGGVSLVIPSGAQSVPFSAIVPDGGRFPSNWDVLY